MLKRFLPCLLFFLVQALHAQTATPTKICGDPNPSEWMTPATLAQHPELSAVTGISADMMRAVFNVLGKEVIFTADLPWKRCLNEVQNGNIDQARSVVRDIEKTMPDKLKTPACRAISAAFIHAKNNDPRLTDELANAVAATRENVGLSTNMKLGLAKNCLESDMKDEASEVILEVMRNSTNDNEIKRAIGVFESAGQGELGKTLADQSRTEVMELVAAGVKKAKMGDFIGAVELMSSAVRQMPNNPQVVTNAALAFLKCLEHNGWEHKMAQQARRLIENSCRLDPTNPRNSALHKLYEDLQKKYGISKNSA